MIIAIASIIVTIEKNMCVLKFAQTKANNMSFKIKTILIFFLNNLPQL